MSQALEVFPHQIIRASAGSGKTYKLSERYLKLLLEGAPIESILATTFTRKAAGEIQARVLKRLGEGAVSPEGAATLSEQLSGSSSRYDQEAFRKLTVKVVRAINRLRICTLDAFFMRLAGSYAFEIGLPPGWSIVDDTENNTILKNAILKTFAQTNGASAHEIARLLFKGETSKSLEKQVFTLTQNALEIFNESQKAAWRAISLASWAQTEKTEDECRAALETAELNQTSAKKDDSRFVKARNRILESLGKEDWIKILEDGLVAAALGRKEFYGKKLSKSLDNALLDVYQYAQVQQGVLLKKQLEKQHDAVWHVLDSIAHYFRQMKSSSGAYRFEDLSQKIADYESHGDFTQIDYRLDSKTRHLLLDEFQDASNKQWSIIRPFAEAIANVNNAALDPTDPNYAEKLASFFCVGDVKQAIYGWRGGVAEIFNEIQKQLKGLKQTDMVTNWRSCPTIIEVVNKLFCNLALNPLFRQYQPDNRDASFLENSEPPAQEGDKVKRLKREAVADGLKNWSANFVKHQWSKNNERLDGFWAIEVAPDQSDEADVSVAARQAIVDAVDRVELEPIDSSSNVALDFAAEEDAEINAENDSFAKNKTHDARKQREFTLAYAARRIKNLRDRYPKASIGVLVRSNDYLGRLLRRLKRLGVKASEEGGAPLVDAPSVGVTLSLFRLAAHPGDSVDAFNIANVPPLARKLKLVVGDNASPETVDSQECRRLSAYLRTLVETKGIGNFAAEIRDVLAPICDDQRQKERLDQFVEFAFSYQASSPNATLDDFVKAAEAHRVQAPSDSTVRVMTIHGSKGLEFDIVVLPQLDKTNLSSVGAQNFIVGRKGAFEPIESVMKYVNQTEQALLPDELLKSFKAEIQKNFEESLCLLYVAITRPKRMLLAIVDSGTFKKPTKEDELPQLSFAKILCQGLCAVPFHDEVFPADAMPRRVFEWGARNWGDDLKKDIGENADFDRPEPSLNAPLFRRSERRRLLYSRQSPTDSRNPIVWKRPEIFVRGKCVHACYEHTLWLDVDGAPDDALLRRALLPLANFDHAKMERAIAEFREMCRSEFTQLLMSRATYETANAKTNPFFSKIPCAVANASALKTPKIEVRREYCYRLLDGEKLLSGVVDRLVLLYDDERLVAADVVDFKTDVYFPNSNLLDEYLAQLHSYGKAVENLFQLPADKISLRIAFVTLERLVDARTGAIACFSLEENEA